MRLSRRQAGGSRLLLVEQDPHVIDELRDHFGGPMFECEVALNIETAWQVLDERRMDAIVVDVENESIEIEDIPDLIPKLKEKDEEMNVVIFNGVSDKPTQRKMRRLGADGYLSVKSDLNAVVRSVRRVLGMEG
jgi:DNA-binding NtrC family response regulator